MAAGRSKGGRTAWARRNPEPLPLGDLNLTTSEGVGLALERAAHALAAGRISGELARTLATILLKRVEVGDLVDLRREVEALEAERS